MRSRSRGLLTAKSLQLCPTLCDPIDSSLPGSSIPGILQARTLEWFAISLSNAWKWKVKVKLLSRDWLLATPWTTAYQAPPSMGFFRQEYWSRVPLPSPRSKLMCRWLMWDHDSPACTCICPDMRPTLYVSLLDRRCQDINGSPLKIF